MARGHRSVSRPETLYQLQSRWDDERTARRIRELRGQASSDLRWLPIIALLLMLLTIAFAAITP